MIPKFLEKGDITLAGMDFYGDPFTKAGGWSEQNEIGQLWQRFMSFCKKNEGRIKWVSDGGYEVWFDLGESESPKNKYIFVGGDVESVKDLPLELVAKVLPKTTYAVFTLKGAEIKSNWSNKIYKEWLPKSPYKEAHPFLIEYYDSKRFKGLDNAESELDIYIPITK